MSMVKCTDCGKEIPEDEAVYYDMCTELWTAEIDLEDMEAEEEARAIFCDSSF